MAFIPNWKSIIQFHQIRNVFSDVDTRFHCKMSRRRIEIFLFFRVIQGQPSSNHLEPSIQSNNRHGVLISSNILDDEYNQSRSHFDNENPSNSLMVRSFPPPYTETCPLNTLNREDRYCPDQRINDGVLYQLDSQYLHQLLPSNANSYTHTISTNHICDRYRNDNRK